jgi:hypothetical protein
LLLLWRNARRSRSASTARAGGKTGILNHTQFLYNGNRKHPALEYGSPVAIEQRYYEITVTEAA